jgi:hypothetical protein
MRRLRTRALAVAATLTACRAAAAPDCICTASFAAVTVTVVDTTNAPVSGLAPVITVRSTGRVLVPSGPAMAEGRYYVVTDANHQAFALDGDTLHFAVLSASRSAAADFVVGAPGLCHCHVHLVTGPDTLVLR